MDSDSLLGLLQERSGYFMRLLTIVIIFLFVWYALSFFFFIFSIEKWQKRKIIIKKLT